MSALPRSVKKKIKEAEDLHAKVYTPPVETPEAEAEAKPDAEKVAAVEDNADLTIVEEPKAEVPAPDDTPEQLAEEQQEPVEDAWEQKYRVLNGKYKAEVPTLHRQVKTMQAEVAGLHDLLANLQTAKQQVEVPAAEQTIPQGSLLKPDEIEDYGSDLIDVMKRAGREAMSPELKRMKDEIASLNQQLGGVSQSVAMSGRDKVFNLLSSKVPNWEELNNDPGFLSWLDQSDPYSGIPRQQMLTNAFGQNDGARVITFFQGYLNENDTIQTAQQEVAPQRIPQKKLDDLVAPGRPKAPVAAAQKGKRTWTQAQIAAFYKDVNSGKYRNNPDKKTALEQDIINAPLEGRLVY